MKVRWLSNGPVSESLDVLSPAGQKTNPLDPSQSKLPLPTVPESHDDTAEEERHC
jgi:hypothetical protein